MRSFEAADYVVFALMLSVSAGIGIFYAFWGGKQKTTKEFLMADRSMQIVPVSISILVSFMSAILILGTPAEMYNNGTEYVIYVFGICLAIVLSTVLFVPLLFNLKLTSSFEVSDVNVFLAFEFAVMAGLKPIGPIAPSWALRLLGPRARV